VPVFKINKLWLHGHVVKDGLDWPGKMRTESVFYKSRTEICKMRTQSVFYKSLKIQSYPGAKVCVNYYYLFIVLNKQMNSIQS
jgi:hypothetical protein